MSQLKKKRNLMLLLEVSMDEFVTKMMNDLHAVQKSYVVPSSNADLLNQAYGRGLDLDEGNAVVDLIVNQSAMLQEVFVDPVSTLRSSINVWDGDGGLSQAEEGHDPFATVGNIATSYNKGYDVTLEPVQFLHRINKTTLLGLMNSEGWENEVSARMFRLYSNLLLKLALFGSPASGGDPDIEKGYNYVGNNAMSRPRIGVRGWLDTLKKGYTYKKEVNGSTTTVTATVGAVVNTYDTSASKFKSIQAVLEEMVRAYPAEHDGEDVVIMLSKADFLDFAFYVAGKDASTSKYESGQVYAIGGYKLMIIPFLQSISKTVTVSAVEYYPGMVLMGRTKDLVLKINNKFIDMNSDYYPKLRTRDTIYDIPVAFGAIIQRFVIAYRVISR